MSFENKNHFHLVGIKGSGMTALAEYLLRKGKKITGSDTEEKFFTDEILKKLGIKFKEGFRVGNLPKSAEVLIHSTAFLPATNPEIKEAEKRGLKILTYPEALDSETRNFLISSCTGVKASV